MGIYACPRCGNPNGWWSGNMRDIHDCPGPTPDTRKPWERSDWTCARARVDSDGMHCPEDKCADCPNRTRGVKEAEPWPEGWDGRDRAAFQRAVNPWACDPAGPCARPLSCQGRDKCERAYGVAPCAICESPDLCKQQGCGDAEWKRTHGVAIPQNGQEKDHG